MSFPIELTHTLVKDIFGGESSYICETGTLTHTVHHLKTVASLCAVKLTFCKHQIYVGKTEEGEIGRVENCVAIGSLLFLVFVVVLRSVDKLHAHVALILVAEVLYVLGVFSFVDKTSCIVGKKRF